MHLNDASADFRLLHAANIVSEEKHLRVADARHEVKQFAVNGRLEAYVGDVFLLIFFQAPVFEVSLPGSAERGI